MYAVTKYQIGDVIRYNEKSGKCDNIRYGCIVQIRLSANFIQYVTQDGVLILESSVETKYVEQGIILDEESPTYPEAREEYVRRST